MFALAPDEDFKHLFVYLFLDLFALHVPPPRALEWTDSIRTFKRANDHHPAVSPNVMQIIVHDFHFFNNHTLIQLRFPSEPRILISASSQ